MPIAPSFQKMEILCSPFTENNKQYVRIRNQKTGTERKVRWYSDQEYNRLYPNQKTEKQSKYYKPQKEVLGFGEEGYITIYKGITPSDEEFFRKGPFRNSRWWGWYLPSSFSTDITLPAGVQPIKLYWSSVGEENGSLKTEEKVIKTVKELLKNA